MANIRLHKELNRKPIKFKKEVYIRAFKEIVLKFNQNKSLDGEVFLTNEDLKKKIGITSNIAINEFLNNFHAEDNRKNVYNIDGEDFQIRGGMFSSKHSKEGVGFMINGYWKQYFYSKLDIDKWHEVKGNKQKIDKLQETKEQKVKLLNMMTSVINNDVKGKYNQRLLDLLMQFKNEFFMGYDDFKKILEIPKSYSPSDIDKRILNPAKKELLKADIKIIKIEKAKKGKSISSIKIIFKKISSKQTVSKLPKVKTEPFLQKSENKIALSIEEKELSLLKTKILNQLNKNDFINKSNVLKCSNKNELLEIVTLLFENTIVEI